MKKTIKALERDKCTGCYSCYNACKLNAIEICENDEGFIFPFIDEQKCVWCGKCADSCPVLNIDYSNNKTPDLYAVRADDAIRAVSSSGGIFTVLAEEILDRAGYVCGAAFDDELNLNHIIVNSELGLAKLRGSKYVQSNIGKVYAEIEKLLKRGDPVLFTGTPCQVAGLKAYLGKDYKELYTVDIICHGVPSQRIFHKYLEGVQPEKIVKEVRFRDKRFGWSCQKICIINSDGSEYVDDSKTDVYLRGFFNNAILRKSCSDCPFAEFPRQGDISIGDFWGISKLDKSQYDKKGTSLVYVNSKKGKRLFESIEDKLKIKQFDFKTTKISNRIQSKQRISQNRKRIFKFLNSGRFTFAQSLRRAFGSKYDIGIVSNYYAGNFGGSLTQYALYNVLEEMGYSCLMIERPADASGKASLETMSKIYIELPYESNAMARQRASKEEMSELNNICDSFVVGSDQLFQYSLYNSLGQFVALDWVDNTKKKIAYAASFGHDKVWGDPKVLAEMSFFMRKFDAFSVREESGVAIANNDFGVEAEWVLDPVFLCEMKYYDRLIKKSERRLPKHYIGSYILDPTVDKAEIIKSAQKALGFKAQIFSEFNHSEDYVKPLDGLDVLHLKVEERLQLIKNCDFFITDSFHGTCFAIIMGKPFVSIKNTGRGGSRFESLLSMLGLSDRLITQSSDLTDPKNVFSSIDYDKVYEILNSEKERCLKWLQTALESKKTLRYSDYDVLIRMIRKQQKEIDSLRKRVSLLSKMSKIGLDACDDVIDYLTVLNENIDNYIILIAVKDTPGMSLSREIAMRFDQLGLKTDLTGKHWHSYAAIIDGGILLDEKLSTETVRIDKIKIGEKSISLVSSNFKVLNIAKIVIDGHNYSINRRGFNIVVIDKFTGEVVDSVCFDMHLKDYKCYR